MELTVADVVIGTDIDAVRFAHTNNFFLIKNRQPYHHSYEDVEEEWAAKCYELFELGLCPITDGLMTIRVEQNNCLKVISTHAVVSIKYKKLHLYDDENVQGASLNRELKGYRVIDWFDCTGLYDLDIDKITTADNFVSKITFFMSKRIDGNSKYLDLLCESFLTQKQLSDFNYSDTMARFKIKNLLKSFKSDKITLKFWKRDIYPVYK